MSVVGPIMPGKFILFFRAPCGTACVSGGYGCRHLLPRWSMQIPTTLAMILAGGRVDELGVLTHYRPKSAVPFGGFARVIDFPLSNLLHSGIERIAILSQYRSYS